MPVQCSTSWPLSLLLNQRYKNAMIKFIYSVFYIVRSLVIGAPDIVVVLKNWGYRLIEVNLERKLRRAVYKNVKCYSHRIKIVYMLIINKYRERHLRTSIKRTLWLTMAKRKISHINIWQCWGPFNHILWHLCFIFGETTGYLLDLSDLFDIKN